MYKDQGIGYVFLVNNDDASKIDNVLNAYLIAGKSGLKNTKPIAHKAAKVDPKVYDAYVGRYEIGHDDHRDVHPRGRPSHGPARPAKASPRSSRSRRPSSSSSRPATPR